MIEEIELPVCELLAKDPELVAALVKAVLAPKDGPEADAFGREALRAAGRTDDLELLDYSTELYGAESSVRGLFGMDAVNDARAVTIGTGNTLRTDLCVQQDNCEMSGGLAGLEVMRQDASQVRAQVTASAPATRRSTDL